MSLFAMFKSAGPTGFVYGSTAEQVTEGLSLAGQTILVTGCNSGIGQEACRVLALRGALVLGTATLDPMSRIFDYGSADAVSNCYHRLRHPELSS
jgi:NADPH:quinone reductase-like Zn-dependent oxidoreductase